MAERNRSEAEILSFPGPRPAAPGAVSDLRFRALIGESAWAALPEATRARFGKRIAGCAFALYAGEVVECRISSAGWLLAQLCRLIGSPLPLSRDSYVPASVSVTEDVASGGQHWTRIYARRRGRPQVIGSCKSFSGPTGLEERIGGGVGIALRAVVEDGALHFLSDHYFVALGAVRLRLPRWLAPGRLRISHVDCGGGLFAFVLALDHPLLGELIRQTVTFRDCRPEGE